MSTMPTEGKIAHQKKRSTAWQVSNAYNCSIVGTCLSRSAMRKIARKKAFKIEPKSSDYEIHQQLANIISDRNPISRKLNRILDQHYRVAIKKYEPLDSEEAIISQWKNDVKNSDIAGAYWAILTHPLTDQETAHRVYGECHMLSFDTFFAKHTTQDKSHELGEPLEALKEKMIEENYKQKMEIEKLQNELLDLQYENRENIKLRKENERLKAALENLTQKLSQEHLREENVKLNQQIQSCQKKLAKLNARNFDLESKILEQKEQIDLYKRIFGELNIKKASPNQGPIQNDRNSSNIPNELKIEDVLIDCCENCENKSECACETKKLCGKTVLYVGGLHKMVPRYKELVENHGGSFLHHDGGKEKSHHVLAKMLGCADAVFCPVNCISHEACKRVKKVCKQHRKPFVMMRSSGLSSLAKGLQMIAQ